MGVGRRQFITALGGATIGWPLAARAQPAGKVAQVGMLYPGVSAVTPTRIAALREGLRLVHYEDAGRLEILVRASEGDPARLPSLAAELVERKVDAIVAISPLAVRAAKAATTAIPIVANDLESDPVTSGTWPTIAFTRLSIAAVTYALAAP